MRFNSAKKILVAAIAVFVALAGTAVPASAFPEDHITDHDCGGRFYWLNSSGIAEFDAQEQSVIDQWAEAKNFTGSQLVDIKTTNQGIFSPYVPVILGWAQPGDLDSFAQAGTACRNEGIFIVIDESKLPNSQPARSIRINRLMLHEIGHVIGLHHTGANEAYDQSFGSHGSVELMASGACGWSADNLVLSQDDVASAAYGLDTSTGKSVHANMGFENDVPLRYWGRTDPQVNFIPQYSGQKDGQRAALMTPNTAGDYIFQTATLAGAYFDERHNVRARTHYKVWAGSSGRVKLEVLRQPRNYKNVDGTSSCSKAYNKFHAKGRYIHMDTVTSHFAPWKLVKSKKQSTLPSSWQALQNGSTYQIPNGAVWDGIALRVRFRSEVLRSNGTPATISIDNLRIIDVN